MAQPEQLKQAAASPVETDEPGRVESGVALCLSGGGYRAMIFHVGAIWRLNELGYLAKLDRVSSVSGGSITAGVLGLNWHRLQFDANGVATNLDEEFVKPLRKLASKTIDLGAVIRGILLPGSISDRIAGSYRKHVFGDATLQDLPDRPRFVINSTNLQTGALWRFSKPYMADYTVGHGPESQVELAVAVAASSAFPPILSPVDLSVDPESYDPAENGPLHTRRTRPTSCSPTAACTTTSGSRQRGSVTRRSSSATAAARWRRSRSRSTTGRARPTACSA